MAPTCQQHSDRPATFVCTMLQTGDGFQLCDECLHDWSISLLAAMTETDPTVILAAVSDPASPSEPEAEEPSADSSPAEAATEGALGTADAPPGGEAPEAVQEDSSGEAATSPEESAAETTPTA